MILKVCGITNAEDAAAAIAAGATAIGFNFYPASPRYITPERAAAIFTPGAHRVGVFVNETPARIEEIARTALLDIAQLHGDETPLHFPVAIPVWKAARVDADFNFSHYQNNPADALLLDGPAAHLYGGAGQTFNWQLAAGTRHRIIIAGGLDAGNVARAIAMAHPWGVDSCSKLESAPGIKDHIKMTEFLHAARAALSA
jgi:phosphoribosylanthranilate isomerase